MNIYPIVLCGGQGTRLWPLSNRNLPKQFVNLNQESTLFESTLSRIKSFKKPIIVTNERWGSHVKYLLKKNEVDFDKLILEPTGKNTFPAICTATKYITELDDNAIALVVPADHYISSSKEFEKLVRIAATEALKNPGIVLFGIKPLYPETSYGYMHLEDSTEDIKKINKFIEKPTKKNAIRMLDDGNFLWNSGIFISTAKFIQKESKRLHRETYEFCSQLIESKEEKKASMHLDKDKWDQIKPISFDYAIMESQKNIKCIEFNLTWSDLGNFSSLKKLIPQDTEDNSKYGNVFSINSKNNLLWNSLDSVPVICSDINNCNVIVSKNGVLVTDVNSDVSKILNIVYKSNFLSSTDESCYRPWGFYNTVKQTENYHIKELFVYSKQRLSLQSHKKRDEVWVIVSGSAEITLDDKISHYKSKDMIFIPKNMKHRVKNVGEELLVLVEVQLGDYFGEDDIRRYQDDYNRE